MQMIVDLHHVAPDTVKVAWNAAAGRLALVTDAAPAAGMGDGEFVLGGRRIEAEDGVVRGPEGQLAGSALTMIEAVRNLHSLGVTLEAALARPAKCPRGSRAGRISDASPRGRRRTSWCSMIASRSGKFWSTAANALRREPAAPRGRRASRRRVGYGLRGRERERQRLAVAARAGRSGSTSRSRACCRGARACAESGG